jgi:hypothetical protein
MTRHRPVPFGQESVHAELPLDCNVLWLSSIASNSLSYE